MFNPFKTMKYRPMQPGEDFSRWYAQMERIRQYNHKVIDLRVHVLEFIAFLVFCWAVFH